MYTALAAATVMARIAAAAPLVPNPDENLSPQTKTLQDGAVITALPHNIARAIVCADGIEDQQECQSPPLGVVNDRRALGDAGPDYEPGFPAPPGSRGTPVTLSDGSVITTFPVFARDENQDESAADQLEGRDLLDATRTLDTGSEFITLSPDLAPGGAAQGLVKRDLSGPEVTIDGNVFTFFDQFRRREADEVVERKLEERQQGGQPFLLANGATTYIPIFIRDHDATSQNSGPGRTGEPILPRGGFNGDGSVPAGPTGTFARVVQ